MDLQVVECHCALLRQLDVSVVRKPVRVAYR